MSTSVFQTQTDQVFFSKLFQSIRRIFSTQKQQWTCEQILRFLSLLKVETLQTIFYEFKISGELLFDVKYLWSQIANYLENKTYFPIMKLMYVISKLNILDNRTVSNVKFLRPNNVSNETDLRSKYMDKQEKQRAAISQGKSGKFFQKCNKSQSFDVVVAQKRFQAQITDQQQTEYEINDIKLNYVYAQGDILQALEKEFKKLGESLIADLSCNQLARIFKSTQNLRAIELSQLIKKFSIDGYCIVCLLADKDILLQEIRSFFSMDEIAEFEEILNLILPFYYKQMFDNEQRQKNKFALPQFSEFNSGYVLQKSDPKTSQDLQQTSNLRQSFARSQMGTSQMGTSQMGTSQMGTSQMGTSQIFGESQAGSESGMQYGTSQYDTAESYERKQSMGRSSYGQSQYENSVYEKSQLRNSEYASSEYPMSEVGSIRGSLAESVMGQSMMNQGQYTKEKRKDVRISSVQDMSIIQRLKQVGLSLPFNLFKMDPLQNIKMTSLNYPFSLNFQKPKNHQEFVRNLKQSVQKLKQCSSNSGGICSKDFNITGVKFGRSQQNDYRYPDELSISAKHAQIGFWNNKYQLVDLQSKTGTFLYIPLTRPLTLKDEHIIQLSNEVEIIVHLLKKQATQGTIKLEFTKPQNQPFYKATLKQGQTLKIGHSQKSHIKLSQQSISSKHTQIKYENKEFKLYDCLSSTGTWLRLSKKGVKSEIFPLEEGDIIRISSKKTYMIEKVTNSLEEDEQLEEMSAFLENPNFKIMRQNSQDNFNQIIQNAMKRKLPHQKKREVHFEEPL